MNKTLRRVSLPRPAGAARARRGRPARLLALTLPGRRRQQAPASHAAALAGPGPARSGQTKREENEAGGRVGCVCSAPRRRCQRQLPRPGTDCVPPRLPGSRMGSAACRGRGSVPALCCLRRPGSTALPERAGLLRLAASILGAVPVASQVTNTRGGWQTTQRGLSAVQSPLRCCPADLAAGRQLQAAGRVTQVLAGVAAHPRTPGHGRRPSQRCFPDPEGSIPALCRAVPCPRRSPRMADEFSQAQAAPSSSLGPSPSTFPGSLAGGSARPNPPRGKPAAHALGARGSRRRCSVWLRCPADRDAGEHGQGGPASWVPRLLCSR